MATIVKKKIKGHAYYYVVQTGWVDGRSRVVSSVPPGVSGEPA